MNRLSKEKRIQIVKCLVEGNSLRATSRMCDIAYNTVLKFLPDIGKACSEYQEKVFHDLKSKRIQCDEIWSFCYSKEKNVPDKLKGQFGYGDIWTWIAIDADSKLVISWLAGDRTASTGYLFMKDVASRIKNRVQLTTDGHKPYLSAVENAFGADIDYATLVKLYGPDIEQEKRYSPPKCLDVQCAVISGDPDPKYISTSYVERQNLTMRMSMRRFTRLTNGFSKKVENHIHAIALHYMYYNFCRIHKTLKVTPAMEAKVTDRLWDIEGIVNLIE